MTRIYPLADDVLEFELTDIGQRHHVADHLRASGQWVDVVAGIDRIAVAFDPSRYEISEAAETMLTQIATAPSNGASSTETLEIPVRYGGEYGPDLASICETLGMSEADFIEMHTSREYTVEMIGFTPGFAYIGGLPTSVEIPRLSTPRQSVAAGSVGMITGYTGLYALAGPGGWPIIGATDMSLFDASSPDPFVVRAGQTITFIAA